MVKAIEKITLIFACLPLFCSTAYSCSCMDFPPTFKVYPEAKTVFVGLVTDIKDEVIETFEKMGVTSIPRRITRTRYVVLVEESFRGDLKKGMELSFFDSRTTCSYSFAKHTRYLIYPFEVDGKMLVQKCSRTRPLTMAEEDLKYIRGLNDQSSKGIIHGLILNRAQDTNGYFGLRTPPEDLTVIVEGNAGKFRTVAYRAGYFEINNLPPGTYRIRVEGANIMRVSFGNQGQSSNQIPVQDKQGTEITVVVTIPKIPKK